MNIRACRLCCSARVFHSTSSITSILCANRAGKGTFPTNSAFLAYSSMRRKLKKTMLYILSALCQSIVKVKDDVLTSLL